MYKTIKFLYAMIILNSLFLFAMNVAGKLFFHTFQVSFLLCCLYAIVILLY